MPLALTLTLLAAVGYGLAWYRLSLVVGHRWPASGRPACWPDRCVPALRYCRRWPATTTGSKSTSSSTCSWLWWPRRSWPSPRPLTRRRATLPCRARRALLRASLHSPAVSVLTAPATAVTLALGGLYLLYLTGLYQAAERDSVIHAAVHLQYVPSGLPAELGDHRHRPNPPPTGHPGKAGALFIAAAGHDTLAKLMYAWMLPAGGGWPPDRPLGAELMYYGGTGIDVALAVIVMTQWYLAAGRALARTRRRSAVAGP